MKQFIAFIALMLMFSCSSNEETLEVSLTSAQCKMCAKSIKKAVKTLDGISYASVDHKKKIATIKYDKTKLKPAAIENVIAEAGYHANKTMRKDYAYAKLDDCCREPQDRE